MASPEASFQRVSGYSATLPDGRRKAYAIYRGGTTEGSQYNGYVDAADGSGYVGGFTIERNDPTGDVKLVNPALPETDTKDRFSRPRALAMLAYEALSCMVPYGERETTDISMDPDAIGAGLDTYRRVLGMRQRRAGHLSGGREQSATARVSVERALGRIGETLRLAQVSREAPSPLRAAE